MRRAARSLVLAFGSRANDFGTPGVVEHCTLSTAMTKPIRSTLDCVRKSCAASSRAARSTLLSSVAALPVWS
jgi:NADH dehydrogenase FAD-containing subunit